MDYDNFFISISRAFWACVHNIKIDVAVEVSFTQGMYHSRYFEKSLFDIAPSLKNSYEALIFLYNDNHKESLYFIKITEPKHFSDAAAHFNVFVSCAILFFVLYFCISMINLFSHVNIVKNLNYFFNKKNSRVVLGAGSGTGEWPFDTIESIAIALVCGAIIAAPVLAYKYFYPDFKKCVIEHWHFDPQAIKLNHQRVMREIGRAVIDSPVAVDMPKPPKYSKFSLSFNSYFNQFEPYFNKITTFFGANFTVFFLFFYFFITLYLFFWTLKRFKAIYPEIKRQQNIRGVNAIMQRMADHKEDAESYNKARLASTEKERKKLMKEHQARLLSKQTTLPDIWKFP